MIKSWVSTNDVTVIQGQVLSVEENLSVSLSTCRTVTEQFVRFALFPLCLHLSVGKLQQSL